MPQRSILALVLGSNLLFAGLASAAPLEPLRVANQKSGIKLLLQAAGELTDVPYTLDFSEFPAAAPLGEALNAGAVDVGGLGDAPYVFALGAGAPLKVISITHADGRFSTSILVPKDSPLHSAADLKGKRIVTNRGSIGHFLVIKALRDVGLRTSDVTFVNLLPTDARSALESGNADAWSTWDPYTTIAITQNGARVLRRGDDLLTNNLYLAATAQAIEAKRPQLEDFVKRIERAYRWANGHPREYAQAQAKVTGLPLEVHLTSASNTDFQRVDITDAVIANLQETADIYREEGVLSRPVDVSNGFDKSFNAARAQGAASTPSQASR
ncbi:putative aliphatic sulfonates-binding protein [Pseudomonas reidholzensis]|uniref:Putative aliphatic sulfonates-binding protein n=1 Tax=Pseudomonas reidholzensis TaxID=1785162 RepID=A0A383RRP3_9PSED|nr:ABC transporter substrate-binding protein [Pseudomonas reidholzensis]SYX89028.1 putative aliphatic sulfonates-binding protein [Pseudomonas reidholzensis]